MSEINTDILNINYEPLVLNVNPAIQAFDEEKKMPQIYEDNFLAI